MSRITVTWLPVMNNHKRNPSLRRWKFCFRDFIDERCGAIKIVSLVSLNNGITVRLFAVNSIKVEKSCPLTWPMSFEQRTIKQQNKVKSSGICLAPSLNKDYLIKSANGSRNAVWEVTNNFSLCVEWLHNDTNYNSNASILIQYMPLRFNISSKYNYQKKFEQGIESFPNRVLTSPTPLPTQLESSLEIRDNTQKCRLCKRRTMNNVWTKNY